MMLAIDIGGTKTLMGFFKGSRLVRSHKFETPADYATFVAELEREIPAFLGDDTPKTCVAAVPAKINREQGLGVAFGNRPWENVPIGSDLSRITGLGVRIENDANLAGLSEAQLVPEYKKALYVTVSTGIGGAYVVDGKLDPNLIDSEIGHMLLEHEGTLQTWEGFASGQAITRKYGMRAADITDPKAWYVIARNIAIGLINVIATTDPDVVIMGGGVGTHLAKFKDRLEEELRLYQSSVVDLPVILQAKRPEEAVLYGCYALSQQS